MGEIQYKIRPQLPDRDLNDLFASSWDSHAEREFGPLLAHSLTYVAAFDGSRLVGFVNVAWDGGVHGFILDTTVHREYQRRGIGTELMRRAAMVAAERELEWLHVDYEPHLDAFYRGCGYQETQAGLLNLRDEVT